MAVVLNIEFVTLNGHHARTSLPTTKVTARAVESLVNGFCAPDLMSVKIKYLGSSIHFNKGFDSKEFLKWWKRAKLGI